MSPLPPLDGSRIHLLAIKKSKERQSKTPPRQEAPRLLWADAEKNSAVGLSTLIPLHLICRRLHPPLREEEDEELARVERLIARNHIENRIERGVKL